MGQQRLNQKKTVAPTREQPSKTSVKSSVHPVEELQAAIGNREMGQYLQSQSNHRSSPLPHELTLPSKMTPIQAKPQFRGLSSELIAASRRLTIQPKLTIGEPGDQYEQEADRVAAEVVNRINTPSSQPSSQGQPLQRQADTEEDDQLQMKPLADTIQRLKTPDEEEDDELQMKPMLQHRADRAGMVASSDLEASIQRLRGSGQPLAKQIREPMEQAFGADLNGVRVHVDAQSDRLNQSIQAKAFTTGQDIFFRQGTYKPGSRDGQELLAHELTHVVQQRGNTIQRKTRDLKVEMIEDLVTKKTIRNTVFTGKTNTEIIVGNIKKYNEIDPSKHQDYKKQKSILKTIILAGEKWKEKRINPSNSNKIKNLFSKIQPLDTDKKQAIENVQQDAATELLAVKNQESQANGNLNTKESNSKIKQYATEVLGGVESKESEISNTINSGMAGSAANELPNNFISIFEGAKKLAEQPAKNTLEAIINAGKRLFVFVSKWGILDILGFILSIRNLMKACDDKTALEEAHIQARVMSGPNKVKQGDQTLWEALSHGYGKVQRRFYSNLYNFVMSAISLGNRLAIILSGGTGAAINLTITVAQVALNVIITAYRKFKGISKLLKGKRGVHRKQSAENIFKAALNKNEVALQLMVDLKINERINDKTEMLKYITSGRGSIDHQKMISALADKLKSQA